MDDILSQIIAYAPDKIDTEIKARALVQGSRNMDQEPRMQFNNGLSVDPERDSFKKISNVIGAYNRYRRGEKNPTLNFNQFFELYSTENFAEGGRSGYKYAGIVKQGPNKGKHKYTDFYPKKTNGSLHEWFDSKKEMNEALQQRKEASGRGLTEKELTKKYKKQIEQKGYKTWGEVPDNIKRSISTNVSSPYEKKGRLKIKDKTVKLFEKTKPIKPSTGLPYTQEEFINLTQGQKQKLVLRMKGEKKPGTKYKKVKGYYPEKEGNRLLNYMKLAAEKQGKLPIKDRTYTNVFVDGKFVGVNDIKNNQLYTHIDYDLSKKGAKKGVSIVAQDVSGKFLHPDMDNFLTYFNAAKKFKTEKPNKVLESYFAKYERVPTYNEIYTFFTTDRNAPLKTYKNNSLTIQHQELMGIEPTKNFQLLTQIKNTEANTILNQLKRGEISKAKANYDLKNIGAAQEGIGIPKKDITASKGLAVAKREAVKLFKDAQKVNPNIVKEITKKLEINLLKLAGTVDPDCRTNAVNGGRIGFKLGSGSNRCLAVAKKASEELIKSGEGSTVQKSLLQKIVAGGNSVLKNTGKFVKGALNPVDFFRLKNLIGLPAAIASAAVDTVSIFDDMVRKGQPFDVAAGNEFLTQFLDLNTESKQAQRILDDEGSNLSPAAKKYAQSLADIGKYKNLLKEKRNLLSLTEGQARPEDLEEIDKQLKVLEEKFSNFREDGVFDYNAAVNELGINEEQSEYIGEPKKAGMFYYAADDESKDGFYRNADGDRIKVNEYGYATKGNIFDIPGKTGARVDRKFPYGETDQGRNPALLTEGEKIFRAETKQPAEYQKPFTYKDFNYQNKALSDEQYNNALKYYQDQGFIKPGQKLEDVNIPKGYNKRIVNGKEYDPPKTFLQDTTEFFNIDDKWKQALYQPGMLGTQEKFSEGGITELRSKYEYKK